MKYCVNAPAMCGKLSESIKVRPIAFQAWKVCNRWGGITFRINSYVILRVKVSCLYNHIYQKTKTKIIKLHTPLSGNSPTESCAPKRDFPGCCSRYRQNCIRHKSTDWSGGTFWRIPPHATSNSSLNRSVSNRYRIDMLTYSSGWVVDARIVPVWFQMV